MGQNDLQSKDFNKADNDKALNKLKGSVRNYEQPFDPIGNDDWETLLLEGLTPGTTHADELELLSNLVYDGQAAFLSD
ncbi:hypothetical protein VRRI112168_01230 [Vreelandella rituensis]|uniref:Uncharacterized protein n=1 Tax=Vreelandella rituensis TaxID=2282306 RepID=A0A368U7H9_9GAMM|nr:hypothetical protein [Halomonas rituensis]RCV93080.1 hypothetical protein DU506_04940 [Halomonas rituensis]